MADPKSASGSGNAKTMCPAVCRANDDYLRTPNEPSSASKIASGSGSAKAMCPLVFQTNADYLEAAIRDREQEEIPEKKKECFIMAVENDVQTRINQ